MFSSQNSQVSNGANYIEDVFSTYLYTGNGSTQTITNGIDLSTKGGMVWLKDRSAINDHRVFDTARAYNSTNYWSLRPNTTGGQALAGVYPNTTGFVVDTNGPNFNTNGDNYASWTFRKQPKFFDVVTYTGDGTSNKSIAHSLGSVPACVIIKLTSAAGSSWQVWHRGSDSQFSSGGITGLQLDLTDAGYTTYNYGDSLNIMAAQPTSTNIYVKNPSFDSNACNASGKSYVAYLFAHNAGGFGLTGTDNVISCGSFTTDGSGNATINLGYEPQWFLVKKSSGTGNWFLTDTMRGFTAPSTSGADTFVFLNPNTSDVEAGGDIFKLNSTGVNAVTGVASDTWIYIAIRRGPMKVPTSGTSVFSPNAYTTNASTPTTVTTNFPVDLNLYKFRTTTLGTYASDRLRGTTTASSKSLVTANTNAEVSSAQGMGIDNNTAYIDAWAYQQIGTPLDVVSWNFQRAPSFFDEVCYTGTGSAMTVSHNLQAVPEMIIVKNRSNLTAWAVYSPIGPTKVLTLNTTNAETTFSGSWNNTAPTSSVFTVGNSTGTNQSGNSMVAYLFATCASVSKVGSYTGNGSTQTINCGFTGGARFVLIKRTDSTGDWYVWDTARGIVTANDPHLSLNTTAAEVTTDDTIDTDSTGFVVNQVTATNVNVSSATYIYLAIA